MTTVTNQTKHVATLTNQTNSGVLIYLVSENLDYYLIGTTSNQVLVAQDSGMWNNEIKN